MKNFLVIDGNSILNRAFYGLAGARMTTSNGIHTNAVFGFLNIYYMICEKFNPDYIAVAFDLKAPTFRHKMYDEYKGTRKGMPDELKEQVPIIKDVLRAMNINIFELEGYEADDILGTIASLNEKKGDIFTYILTGDRDSYQLISNSTSIIYPSSKMGKTEYTIYTPNLLMEEKGIEPYQIIDIKALMGDASDNIPGVKGIGEKTAYNLIHKYTTLDNIYLNIDNLDASEKIKEKLRNDEEMARLSYTLATINCNVPINLDYSENLVKEVNKEELYKLFKKLSFNKFIAKYDFSNINIEIDNNSVINNEFTVSSITVTDNTIKIIDDKNIDEYIDTLFSVMEEGKISYVLNIVSDSTCHSHVSTIEINDKNFFGIYSNINDTSYIINLDKFGFNTNSSINETIQKLLNKFANSKSLKLGCSIKQDIRYIFTNICNNVQNFKYDILLAYYLFDSNRVYKLKDVLTELFNVNITLTQTKQVQLSLFDSNEVTNSIDSEFAKNIALILKCLYSSKDIIDERLRKENMFDLYYNIEIPLSETLASMETVGMYVDKEKLNEYGIAISERIQELEKSIYELAGEEFNINSPQQLGNILFDKLNLPGKKKTKTGYSTSKEVLEGLEEYHEIIPLIIEYRQTMKIKSTYVDGLSTTIMPDNRIHTTFMQTVTSTGRLSSIEPNLQNIPIRLELGSKIRTFFTAPKDTQIVDADYSQIELRVLSHISKDEAMQKAFNAGVDIHTVTASQIFDVNIADVTKQMRSKAKSVNFGIVYGISEFGLSKNIGTSWKEAKEYINTYLEKYAGIHKFMKDIVVEAKENGYVTTLFNRKRYIPELKNKNKNIVLFGERIAMNTPIQGSAADIIKIAMNNLYKSLKENNLKSKLIMQVHDELIVETAQSEIEQVKVLVKEAMENVIKLDVPLEVDLNVGQSWYDAK